ncbi:MAG: ribosome-associated translation inhibitor RaiA [Candidatus Omnitrophota bacterium]
MKITFSVNHLEENPAYKECFEQKAVKVAKHLKRFSDELVYVHGVLDKNPHKKDEFFASVSLFLPSGAIHCRERGMDYSSAINAAFLDLSRQIEKHKAKMTKEKRRKVR